MWPLMQNCQQRAERRLLGGLQALQTSRWRKSYLSFFLAIDLCCAAAPSSWAACEAAFAPWPVSGSFTTCASHGWCDRGMAQIEWSRQPKRLRVDSRVDRRHILTQQIEHQRIKVHSDSQCLSGSG